MTVLTNIMREADVRAHFSARYIYIYTHIFSKIE